MHLDLPSSVAQLPLVGRLAADEEKHGRWWLPADRIASGGDEIFHFRLILRAVIGRVLGHELPASSTLSPICFHEHLLQRFWISFIGSLQHGQSFPALVQELHLAFEGNGSAPFFDVRQVPAKRLHNIVMEIRSGAWIWEIGAFSKEGAVEMEGIGGRPGHPIFLRPANYNEKVWAAGYDILDTASTGECGWIAGAVVERELFSLLLTWGI